MTKPDKITELFRQNAHKLEQMPDETSWQRIQDGLAKKSPTSSSPGSTVRKLRLLPLRIAAGLALLIGLSALFLWALNEQDRHYQQAVANSKRPLQIEELPLAEETLPSPIVQKSVEGTYQPPQKVIEEGRAEQKLIARVTTPAPVRIPVSPSTSDSAETLNRTGR
jgi:hypothetical protein